MDFEKIIKESKDKSLADLTEEVSQLMLSHNYSSFSFTQFEFNGFYRARKHNNPIGHVNNVGKLHVFKNETEFWNVPEKYATLGRCNKDGESIFYCSSDFVTTVLEVKPSIGDFVSVATFGNISNEKPVFRVHPIGKRYLSLIPELKILFGDFKFDEKQIEIEDFLDKLFHQNVEDDQTFKYKLSIAVAHIFFTNGTNKKKEIIETEGLIYPSIIRNQKSYCFALRPWIARCFFRINYIQTIQVLEHGNDFIRIKLIRNGPMRFEKLYPNDMFDIYWLDPPSEAPNYEILKY